MEDVWIYLPREAAMKVLLEKLEKEKNIKLNLQNPGMVVLIKRWARGIRRRARANNSRRLSGFFH